jgi:hypothetical protein
MKKSAASGNAKLDSTLAGGAMRKAYWGGGGGRGFGAS